MDFSNKNIVINSTSKTKKDLFKELAQIGKDLNIVDSQEELEKGFWEREDEGSTGMEYGFAIPHAKIDGIKKPTIIIIKTKEVIKDYETFDKSNVKNIVALLIPKKEVEKSHMNILSTVAVKLTDKEFRDAFVKAETKIELKELVENIDFKDSKPKTVIPTSESSLKFVGITSCAAGIAHTFISAENLVQQGADMGYAVRIETQGASGPETELTAKEIDEADYVVIASDIDVNLDRFNGKKLYKTKVAHAVKNSKDVLERTIKESKLYIGENLSFKSSEAVGTKGASKIKEGFRGAMSGVMNGISWMIPLLVAAAVLLAIPNIAGAFVGKSEIVSQGGWDDYVAAGLSGPWWKFMNIMMRMGWASISLMFPIFAAFSAMAIGNKPAFIPGLIGGFLAKPSMFYGIFDDVFTPGVYPFLDKSSGFWGALIIGLLVGYVIKYSNKWIKVPKIMNAIKPMLILPFIGAIFSVTFMVLVINPAFGIINESLITSAQNSGDKGKYILALVIAPMTASDLGGPINKAAGTIMNTFYENRTISLTIRVIPTITPSIGLGLAAIFDRFIVKRRVFDTELRRAAPNAIILACLGISEGGLPFMFKRPLITIPVNIIGGICGSIIGILTGTEQWFPDSAIWAWPFATPIWGLLLGIFGGAIITMLMHIFLRVLLIKLGKMEVNAGPIEKIEWKQMGKSIKGKFSRVNRKRRKG